MWPHCSIPKISIPSWTLHFHHWEKVAHKGFRKKEAFFAQMFPMGFVYRSINQDSGDAQIFCWLFFSRNPSANPSLVASWIEMVATWKSLQVTTWLTPGIIHLDRARQALSWNVKRLQKWKTAKSFKRSMFQMGVSKNRDTPKLMVYNRKPH